MNSNIIVEIRQQDAISVDTNGCYECQLSKDVIIETGDIVQVNKVFIDTVKEGDINIPNDLTLTLNTGMYFQNWQALTGNTFKNADGSTPSSYVTPDFKRFIPYLLVNSGALSGCTNYTGYNYFIVDDGRWITFNITYSYLDWYGNEQHIITTIPNVGSHVYKNKVYTDTGLNIVAKTGSLKYVSSTYTGTNSWVKQGGVGAAINVDILQPFSFQTNINLKAGVYSPLQLTTLITQELTNTNLSNSTFNQNMTNSKLLLTIDSFNSGAPSPDGRVDPITGNPIILSTQTTFISDDGTVSTVFPNVTNPNWIGASQVALEIDENNRANWNYLHTPMYDATNGTNISVRYLHKGLASSGSTYGVAQHSGIYFQSLIAKETASGKYVDFWSAQLGFNLNNLCVGTGQVSNKFGFSNIISLSKPLVEGVNITNGFYGLDSAIIKGLSWSARQVPPASAAGLCSTINSTVGIFADSTITELLNKFSHYILQSDLGFQNNNYIGQKWYRNINGIISKYYAYGSYAFAESDAGISYQHQGAPIYLKSIKVRLLKSDKTTDINLGNDNTVIMQVIKGGAQQVSSQVQPKRA